MILWVSRGEYKIVSPFGVTMVVISFDAGGWLLETDVVETGKGGPVDVFDGVVRNQKVFLPPHEDEIRVV